MGLFDLFKNTPASQPQSDAYRDLVEKARVSCCVKCGRLHGSTSLPCPYCAFQPSTLDEAASILLASTNFLSLQNLVNLSRSRALGSTLENTIPTLPQSIKHILAKPDQRQMVEFIYASTNNIPSSLAQQFNIFSQIDLCPHCETSEFKVSYGSDCQSCGHSLTQTKEEKFFLCLRNILYVLEKDASFSATNKSQEIFYRWICFAMNNLVLKNFMPPPAALSLCEKTLKDLRFFVGVKKDWVVEVANPFNTTCQIFTETQCATSESFAILLSGELDQLMARLLAYSKS